MTQWAVQAGSVVGVAIAGAIAGGIIALLLKKWLHRSIPIALSLLLGVSLAMLLFILPILIWRGNYAGKLESLWNLFALEAGVIFGLVAHTADGN